MKSKEFTKLPNKLTIALGQYFINRNLSKSQEVRNTYSKNKTETVIRKGKTWDKESDLNRIDNTLPDDWTYTACAGTFWFQKSNKNKYVYTVDEDTWPLAKTSRV